MHCLYLININISRTLIVFLFHYIISYHPLGFAYYPDGAHADADELEPGIAPPGSSSDCDKNMTCAAPMYYVDGDYKGTYSNNEDLVALTNDEDNFGLDDYEPLFFHPLPDWIGYGEFSVFLKVDDTDFSSDIFYFCHVSVCQNLICHHIMKLNSSQLCANVCVCLFSSRSINS